MKSFAEALQTRSEDLTIGSGWEETEHGFRTVVPVSDDRVIEVCIEPLMFGQYYVAVYLVDDQTGQSSLISEKIPVRPGGGAS